MRSRLLDDVQVRVPVGLYEQYLRDKLQPQKKKETPAPVAIIAEEGAYAITGDKGGKPAMKVLLRLRVFTPDECRKLNVLPAGRVWEKITVNGKEARLPVSDGWYRFTPEQPGAYDIAAETVLETEAASGRLTLSVPKTLRTLIRARSPLAWEVQAGDAPPVRGSKENGTDVQIALTPRESLEISYGPPTVPLERAPVYHLSGDIAWNLDAGRMQVTARLSVAILGGRSERLDLALPAAAQRVSITGPDVREAQISGGSAAVFLRGKIAEKTALTVQYELPPPAAETVRFSPPTIRDGRWSGGTLVVTNTKGDSEILAGSATGLQQLALAGIPSSAQAILAGAPAVAYKITSPSFSAEVEIVNLGEFALRESIADLAHFQLAYSRDGAVICKAEYEIRNRNRQFIRITLPKDSYVLIARVGDKPAPITPLPGRADVYLLPLVRSQASVKGLVSFPVEVVFLFRADAAEKREGTSEIPIPTVDLPIAYAWCEAYMPRGMEAVKTSGPLRRVEQYSSDTAAASLTYGSSQLAEGYERGRRFGVAGGREQPVDPGAPGLEKTAAMNYTLMRNYYRAGHDYYQQNKYAEAEQALKKAVELDPKSTEAENARRLLGNIKLARGTLALQSREEKAAGTKVRKEIEAGNVALAQHQKQTIEKYHEALREGKTQEATVQYQAAQALGKQLVAKGAREQEQQALLRDISESMKEVTQTQQSKARELLKDVDRLSEHGDYDKALQVARDARQLIVVGTDREYSSQSEMKDLADLQERMEELAVKAAQQQEQPKRVPEQPAFVPGLPRPSRPPVLPSVGEGQAATQPAAPQTTTRVYDISHLLVRAPDNLGAQVDFSNAANNNAPARQESAEKTINLIKGSIESDSWRKDDTGITEDQGKLIISQTAKNQEVIAALLRRLEEVRGPQVEERAGQIVEQRAKNVGTKTDPFTGAASGKYDGGWSYTDKAAAGDGVTDPALREFIGRNYDWAIGKEGTAGAAGVASLYLADGRPTESELARKLRFNLGQKVQVSSINLNASSQAAGNLGVRFNTGNNNVTYAVIDEGQFRTLMQLDAANRRYGGREIVVANERGQETIVGTDALLANDSTANATFAGDRGNTLDINDNAINLEHDKYILIDNGTFLTVVRAGQMQYWAESAEPATFAAVPETVDVPRVGQLVKFEKTLVDPSDQLVIRITYSCKGETR
ncbi:MAG TPA: hypothetical protein VM098_03850 [Phycisphaerae bacterium]|nr:hypothetical protein [Phycisphaerae bacterium]